MLTDVESIVGRVDEVSVVQKVLPVEIGNGVVDDLID